MDEISESLRIANPEAYLSWYCLGSVRADILTISKVYSGAADYLSDIVWLLSSSNLD